MKVSVIIPTYNREHYICQAIESALRQTMDDIEVIVVDDGSTDGTRDKISLYQDKIKYIYSDNGGPARARNIGMEASSGEYISFLDSDDLYYPYKTELQADFLDKFADIAMVYTEFSAFNDSGFWDEFHLKQYHKSYQNPFLTYDNIFSESIPIRESGLNVENRDGRRIYMGNIFEACFKQFIVFTNSVMFRRKILEITGFQDERYWLLEECDFIMRICKHFKVAFIDAPTYKLRYHSKQISNVNIAKGIDTTIKIQSNLLEIAEKYGLKDNEFYSNNQSVVNERLAILHKALVIPLLSRSKEVSQVRYHLRKCEDFGYPEKELILLTFFPYIFRRIALKMIALSDLFRKK